MKLNHLLRLIVIGFLFLGELRSQAQQAFGSNDAVSWNTLDTSHSHIKDWTFTTEAYQNAATRLLLDEVNSVAHNLELAEDFPITSNAVLSVHIFPPGLGMLGTLTTSNHTYYYTVGRKFTGVDRCNLTASFYELKSRYLLGANRMDTNAAFKKGMELLLKAGIDVVALNRECQIKIGVSGPYGDKFLPDYWIRWSKNGRRVGLLELFAPTRSIRQLHIWDARYCLRQAAAVPNLGSILKDGHAPEYLLMRMGLDEKNVSATATSNGTPIMSTPIKK